MVQVTHIQIDIGQVRKIDTTLIINDNQRPQMNRATGDLETHVLELLQGNPQGVGSGALLLHLLDLEIVVSQPTISRLLKLLDHRGLTQKVSNKGRALTALGTSWLAQTRHRRERVRWVERIMAAV